MTLRDALLTLLIVLAALTACVLAAYRTAFPNPAPCYRLVLDEPGCLAAGRLDLTVKHLDSNLACEVVAEADFDFNWVTVGTVRLGRTHVIAAKVQP
jgi:hypothetical protein